MADFACNACQDGAPTPPPSARSSRKRHNLADFRSLLRLLCESLHITYSELPYRSVGVFRHDIRWSNPLERAAAGEHHVVRVLCETMREEWLRISTSCGRANVPVRWCRRPHSQGGDAPSYPCQTAEQSLSPSCILFVMAFHRSGRIMRAQSVIGKGSISCQVGSLEEPLPFAKHAVARDFERVD